MAVGLILQFEGVDESHYKAVNTKLGLDPHGGTGDWPAGMISHSAGHSPDGGFVVSEVWETEAAQEAFMESRLGPALGEAGVSDPVSITWFEIIATHSP